MREIEGEPHQPATERERCDGDFISPWVAVKPLNYFYGESRKPSGSIDDTCLKQFHRSDRERDARRGNLNWELNARDVLLCPYIITEDPRSRRGRGTFRTRAGRSHQPLHPARCVLMHGMEQTITLVVEATASGRQPVAGSDSIEMMLRDSIAPVSIRS
jgi:hypothetical protein